MTADFRELPAGARQYSVHRDITSEQRTEKVGCAGFARYRVYEC